MQPLRRLGVHARELRIVCGFAWLGQARVEDLGLFARCGLTMLFEHRASRIRQRHQGGALTIQELRGERDQTLTPQMFQVAMPPIATALRLQVAGVGHSERADERQGAGF